MEFEIDKIYNGFKLTEKKFIEDINCEAHVFYHEKSGAKLLHIKNDDDNKVFSISFRTPPNDDTGVPHILEHSVLCGSKKFPTKEPFVELVKGSLNTFLNAMTYSDKTMYPIASRNNKDFFNLMDVYLDAVFHPNIYSTPEILMQEGWHYELKDKNDELSIKGVVYNEMKGAFSSPEGVLMRKIQQSLFPDTPYGFESGGDPEFIPNLTYDDFINFHKKYYHPSNSYIYLYGDLDIEKALKFIDESYLKDFDKIDINSSIEKQSTFNTPKSITVEYPIASDEKEEDKTYLSVNFAMGETTSGELNLAFDILEYLLLEPSSAPLKKALLGANIGKDIFGIYDSSILQPYFGVVLKNSNESRLSEFKDIVFKTLNSLVTNGIDKKLIEAAINIREFYLRESDFGGYPKGLIYSMKCMESWLYDSDPLTHLSFSDVLNKIKDSALNGTYFEDLIKKYILNNCHSSIVIVKPSKTLDEMRNNELKNKLSSLKNSLSDDELDLIIKQTLKLEERQNTQDTEETLKTIPLLSLTDIDKNVDHLPIEEKNIDNVQTLYHNVFTSGISYLSLYFDASVLPNDLLSYGSLLTYILSRVDTKNYSYDDLSNEIDIHTGGINLFLKAFSEKFNDSIFYPKFVIQSKTLSPNLGKTIELINEIIMSSKFDNKKRIKEIIMELKSRMEMNIAQRGNIVSANRTLSYFSPVGSYDEKIKGLDFFNFIDDLDLNFDERFDNLVSNLKKACEYLFNKKILFISIGCSEKDYNDFSNNIKIILDNLKDTVPTFIKYDFEENNFNEALTSSSTVQYCSKGYNYRKLGFAYKGSLQVLKTICSYDYLWNRVRVMGGAYGCSIAFFRNGNMFMTSYRDPNLKNTLNAYDELSNYIENFEASDREMTKYIIGTISDFDTPLSPSSKCQQATARYISHLTNEDLERERQEILSTKVKTIRSLAPLVRSCMDENALCVLGNEKLINDNKDLFKEVKSVFK
jgi:Zn-dependent M16 (insulinase) family peptidase